MSRSLYTVFTILALLSMLSLTCCKSVDEQKVASLYDLNGFIVEYNKRTKTWLLDELDKSRKSGEEIRSKINSLSSQQTPLSADNQKKLRKLTRSSESNTRTIEKYEFRLSLGDFLAYKSPKDIPLNLRWESGMNEPEIGDPDAKKGGTFNTYMRDYAYPATLRPFGPNANSGLRSEIYTDIEMTLLFIHPVTGKPIPGLAKQWAVSEDRRTVYFKLNPKATYSDGEMIRAEDMFTSIYVRVSDNVFTPFEKQYYREQFANITVYDEQTLSATLPESKPDMYYFTGQGLPAPSSPKYYQEYGPDYQERYQWKVEPTTGAYRLTPENINKGRSVTLTRVKDWWAKDLKYFRYRFNPDRIRYLLVRDPSKCYELFKIGEIDLFSISSPSYWYEKTEVDPVFNGYIEKKKFYTDYPLVPLGFYLNMDEGILKNRDVRVGLHYAMDFQKVNDQVFRGDYVRLNQFTDGFGEFTDRSIKVRKYNPKKAREYFAKAGFTEEDKDGILRNAEGLKLSFSCTVSQTPVIIQMLAILQKEALECGVEIVMDALEDGVAFAKLNEKRHEAFFSGWGVTPPFPRYRQFFHSDQAFDEVGNRKHSTNNMNSYADEKMDVATEKVRNARTIKELKSAAFDVQRMLHESGAFIPGVYRDYTAIGHWRWLKWPGSETTKFSYAQIRDPMETYLFWIDEEVKKETLDARRKGEVFPEIEEVIDEYRMSN